MLHHQVCCLVTVPTRCQLAPSPLALFSLPHPSILAALPAPLSCSCLTLPFSPHCLDLVVAFGLPCCCLLPPLPLSSASLTSACHLPGHLPSCQLCMCTHPCLPPAPLPGCLPPWSLTSSQPTSPSLPGVQGCAPLLSPSPSPFYHLLTAVGGHCAHLHQAPPQPPPRLCPLSSHHLTVPPFRCGYGCTPPSHLPLAASAHAGVHPHHLCPAPSLAISPPLLMSPCHCRCALCAHLHQAPPLPHHPTVPSFRCRYRCAPPGCLPLTARCVHGCMPTPSPSCPFPCCPSSPPLLSPSPSCHLLLTTPRCAYMHTCTRPLPCYDRTACTIRMDLKELVTCLYLDGLILGVL